MWLWSTTIKLFHKIPEWPWRLIHVALISNEAKEEILVPYRGRSRRNNLLPGRVLKVIAKDVIVVNSIESTTAKNPQAIVVDYCGVIVSRRGFFSLHFHTSPRSFRCRESKENLLNIHALSTYVLPPQIIRKAAFPFLLRMNSSSMNINSSLVPYHGMPLSFFRQVSWFASPMNQLRQVNFVLVAILSAYIIANGLDKTEIATPICRWGYVGVLLFHL